MSDIFRRLSRDASNAWQDAYGSLVLGDDAGKSAKIVVILKPRQSHSNSNAAFSSPGHHHHRPADNNNNNNNMDHMSTHSPSPPPPTQGPSFLELGMTFLEINGRAYVRTVHPQSEAARAGVMPRDSVQFATVYKREWMMISSTNQQRTARAANRRRTGGGGGGGGGQRRRHSWGGLGLGDDDDDDEEEDDLLQRGQRHDGDDDDHGGAGGASSPLNMTDVDATARRFALECEAKGFRVSYEDLRRILSEGMDPLQSAFTSPNPTSRAWRGPPIPSTINVCAPPAHFILEEDVLVQPHPPPPPPRLDGNMMGVDDGGFGDLSAGGNGGASALGPGGRPLSPLHQSHREAATRPVIIVLRRTRQRPSPTAALSLHFRMDDECDFAASLIRRLAPTSDMDMPSPDTWEELVHDGTDWLLGNGSMLPPKLQQQQQQQRLQIQQQQQLRNFSGHGSIGLAGSDQNSLSGAESDGGNHSPFRHHGGGGGGGAGGAVGLRRRISDVNKSPTSAAAAAAAAAASEEFGNIPMDDYEKERAMKLAKLRSRMAAEQQQLASAASASSLDRSEDLEASTIRGMIQKAVGLAFVKASKVVLGVSLHGGSGIVIARLPDGTWSAPSAIGTWGLGLGIQFGLEVAEYIFILQTQESLDHFRRGGSFTVGGNVGAAVAGMGREAYGAASVGAVCNAKSGEVGPYRQQQEDEYNDDEDSDPNAAATGGVRNKYSSMGIAPIVAYAKSQGLYVGVSLEGSRIFTRDDVNARAYKFATGREVNARDILSGKVATPPEAEDLYASLHSVEFTHEMSCLPRPPECLRKDSPNPWVYDRCTLSGSEADDGSASSSAHASADPFHFLRTLNKEEAEECTAFETQFKKFMYGGVSVQRLIPNSNSTESRSSGKIRKERRTLWLMLPEVGALRLGFVSKLSDGDNTTSVSNKNSTLRAKRSDYSTTGDNDGTNTVASEEVTLDSALVEKDAKMMRQSNVQLSNKHSVALTDVTTVSQEPNFPLHFASATSDDRTEYLRVISIQNVSGTSLLFLANNFREAELLQCGLKLLLERETARLGVRGGLPITALGGRAMDGAMSPSAARGFLDDYHHQHHHHHPHNSPQFQRNRSSGSNHSGRISNSFGPNSGLNHNGGGGRDKKSSRRTPSGYSSSEMENDNDEDTPMTADSSVPFRNRHGVPEGRKNWGAVPGRAYMRHQAAPSHGGSLKNGHRRHLSQANDEDDEEDEELQHHHHHMMMMNGGLQEDDDDGPRYIHGQLLVRDIATKVDLPLPLPLCRVLLLDSTSPVVTKWEKDRGDTNFSKTDWTFPPATPRELERHASEHQLIACGSMMGAHRTTTFDRLRNGTTVRLSETQIVDADDSERLAFTVSERMPRRGFSIKVKVLLRSYLDKSCEATVLAEVRPVGKNMTNQTAVHKAFLLVLNEIKSRYGTEEGGLLSAFLHVVDTMPSSGFMPGSNGSGGSGAGARGRNGVSPKPFPRTDPPVAATSPQGVSARNSGLVSLQDVMRESRLQQEQKANNGATSPPRVTRPSTPSIQIEPDTPKRLSKTSPRRTPEAIMSDNEKLGSYPSAAGAESSTNDNNNSSNSSSKNASSASSPSDEKEQPPTIEVKPLPKIRLSLMPSPREEDEDQDDDSSNSGGGHNSKKKKKKKPTSSSVMSSSSRRRHSSSRRKSGTGVGGASSSSTNRSRGVTSRGSNRVR